ncbi:hypothetical protein BP5796_04326 [Coleophoma crateriformis]|uniref:Xylanolytic transcriptional activator regulatory domain-containing protein n=1 Tax=Coleophoma crateriformis TaxID=565419 RepID=A0A3D8SIJ4_9HELO|nr:hypothetical protein BP5796_04326 [Coleophoma crateriformis]
MTRDETFLDEIEDQVYTSRRTALSKLSEKWTRKKYRVRNSQGQDGAEASQRTESSVTEDLTNVPRAVSVVDTSIRINDIVKATPRAEILRAAVNFRRNFPELSFVHMGRFDVDANGTEDLLFSASIMALCSINNHQEEYVTYVKNGLSSVLLEPPNLITVQSLLVWAMYEWGHGKGYNAWMTTGTAIRMIQSLETMNDPKKHSELDQEIYNRTFWSCFIMDRLVICGKSQPFTLPLDQMHIHLPIGEQDFAFGQSSDPWAYIGNTNENSSTSIDHSYSILVRGFDIWARILKWIINGGRRQPGMTALVNCPWTPGSPWKSLLDEIESWRQMQQPRLKYPGIKAAGHISLGHGEQFAYINLIYYVSILFLSREYIPFLPTPESEPQGPVDPPLLEIAAPDRWWTERADQLFNAAAQITNLLQELDVLNTPLLSPFPGFCSFSAATMNAYVLHFPRMNYGNSISFAGELLDINVKWLSRFKSVWPMGNGWFKTILHTRKLYIKASRDFRRFQGKTRADFEALEASIHDSSGISPNQEDDDALTRETDAHKISSTAGYEAEAAISLQQLSDPNGISGHEPYAFDGVVPDEMVISNQWNHVWPIWGEQQSGSMTAGGIHFDYDFGRGVPGL